MHHRHTLWAALVAAAALLVLAGCDDSGDSDPTDIAADTNAETSEPDTVETDAADMTDTAMPDPVDPALHGAINAAFVYGDETTTDPASMYLIGNDAGANIELRASDLPPLTTGIDCRTGVCAVNGDLSWFTVIDGTQALRAAEVGGDMAVATGDLNLVAMSAEDVTLAGNNLAYVDGGVAYYEDLSDGLNLPTEVGQLVTDVGDGIMYFGGGFTVPQTGPAGLLYRFDRSSLAMFRVGLGGGGESYLGRFGVPGETGGETDGNHPMVVASDGTTAVVLYSGVHHYGLCRSNQDCADIPQATCRYTINEFGEQSEDGLCTTLRRSLQRFDISAQTDLGQTCESDAECDGRHVCKPTADTLNDLEPTSVCSPRELVIGGFGPNACSVRGTEEWADMARKIRITDDDRVVLLGIDECSTNTLNVPNNAVFAIPVDAIDSATTIRDAIQYLEGPYTQDHGQAFCFDTGEDAYNYEDCTINIRDFDLAPGGGLLIVGNGAAEINDTEIWMFDEDGNKFQVTKDVFNDADEAYAVTQ